MHKFMVAFDEEVFKALDRDAKNRNITLQAFLRAVVVPEWIKGGNAKFSGLGSNRKRPRDLLAEL